MRTKKSISYHTRSWSNRPRCGLSIQDLICCALSGPTLGSALTLRCLRFLLFEACLHRDTDCRALSGIPFRLGSQTSLPSFPSVQGLFCSGHHKP